jgi:GDP-mannose transporter
MEKDAAEVKKALATGALKEASASPSKCPWLGMFMQSLIVLVPPILAYCLASILMTVVNKVSTPFVDVSIQLKCSSSLCLGRIFR